MSQYYEFCLLCADTAGKWLRNYVTFFYCIAQMFVEFMLNLKERNISNMHTRICPAGFVGFPFNELTHD